MDERGGDAPLVARRARLGDDGGSVDLRVGGTVRVVMRNPHEDVEYGGGGRYTEIDPPTRLAFTWLWDDTTRRQLIELDFEEHDGLTTVRFTHSGLWDEEAVRSTRTVGARRSTTSDARSRRDQRPGSGSRGTRTWHESPRQVRSRCSAAARIALILRVRGVGVAALQLPGVALEVVQPLGVGAVGGHVVAVALRADRGVGRARRAGW